jgi:serine/threonine protein phosphatase PrpC
MITHSISMLGRRSSNEDQHEIIINLDGNNNDLKNINMFCIFDGHGGKDVAKYLKDHIPPFFIKKHMNYDTNNKDKMKKYIEKVYDHVQNSLERRLKNVSYTIGSTALVSFFYKKNKTIKYYIINVGDCRAVKCNKDSIAIPLSKDHKPHLVDEKKRIENIGGKIIFDGDDWRIKDLSVSRAFGDMDATPYVTHKPEIFNYSLKKNDKFIIFACDGLWDVLTNQEAVDFVALKLEDVSKIISMSGYSKKNVAHQLASYAIEKGSYDNVSVTIVFL